MRQRTLQSLSLVVLLSLAVCCTASKPRHGVAASDGQLAAITPQKLRALDTSFSRLVANALTSNEQEVAGNVGVASANGASEDWVANYYKPRKSTLGEWFLDLVAQMDAEYEKEKREDAYKHSREHQEDSDDEHHHHPAADDYAHHNQHYGYGERPAKGEKHPQYWLLDENIKNKEAPHRSYRPEHHDEEQQRYHRPDGKQYGHEQHMVVSAPIHEQYDEPEHRQHEEEHHGPDHREQHGPGHGPHKHTEEVCVQEVAKSACSSSTVSGNTNSMHYTSSLSCCHSVQGDRYYAEPHYPSEPEYPAYAAMMIRRHRGDAELERVPPAQGPIAHTQIFDIPFDSPRRFYPRGGKAECLWSLAYHDAVVVDENTKQIGIASATCHFNGSMEHCGSPLCEGLTITVSADVYSTYAVSKYPPATPALDATCSNGQRSSSKQIIPTAGLIGGSGVSQQLAAGRRGQHPLLSDSLASRPQRPLPMAGQVPHTAPAAPHKRPSLSDFMVNNIADPEPKQQQPARRSQGIRSHLGAHTDPAPKVPAATTPTPATVPGVAAPAPSQPADTKHVAEPQPKQEPVPATASKPETTAAEPQLAAREPTAEPKPAADKPTEPMPAAAQPVPLKAEEPKPAAPEPAPKQAAEPAPVKAAEPQPVAKEAEKPTETSPGATEPTIQKGADLQLAPREPVPKQSTAAEPAPAKAAEPEPAAQEPRPQKAAAAEPQPAAAEPTPAKAAEPKPAAAESTPLNAAELKPAAAESKPTVAEPSPVKAAEPHPSAQEPAVQKPSEPKPAAAESTPLNAAEPKPAAAEPETTVAEPSPVKAAEPYLAAQEPAVEKPSELKSAAGESTPLNAAEPKPAAAESKPIVAEPSPVKAAEPNPSAQEPAVQKPSEPKPAAGESTPLNAAEPKPAATEPKPTVAEPSPVKAAEPHPAEQKPAVQKPSEPKPAAAESSPLNAAEPKPTAKVGVAHIISNQFMPYTQPKVHQAGYDGRDSHHDEREPHQREYREEHPRYGRKDRHDKNENLTEFINDHTQDSGYFGGEAIIIAGVVTSVKGLERGMDFDRGMLEHVTSFTGLPLSKKAYEALPVDTPHVKHGAYKIVFMGDDERHY